METLPFVPFGKYKGQPVSVNVKVDNWFLSPASALSFAAEMAAIDKKVKIDCFA